MLSLEIFANIVVAVLFFVYWLTVFIILYHLTRFGVGTQPKKFAAIFMLGSIALFSFSLIVYLRIDFANLLSQ